MTSLTHILLLIHPCLLLAAVLLLLAALTTFSHDTLPVKFTNMHTNILPILSKIHCLRTDMQSLSSSLILSESFVVNVFSTRSTQRACN